MIDHAHRWVARPGGGDPAYLYERCGFDGCEKLRRARIVGLAHELRFDETPTGRRWLHTGPWEDA